MMDSNQIGKIVLFLYPIPNSLILPSLLYRKDGLVNTIIPNKNINIIIEIVVIFSLI